MNEVINLVYAIADNSMVLFLLVLFVGVLNVFIPPVPLEALAVLGGYLSGTGHGNSLVVWIAATLGMSTGNLILYSWARRKGESLMRWRIIKRQKTPQYLKKARIWFHRYGVWTIYVGRVIPGMGFAVIFCCGILKIRRWKVYPAIIISNLVFLGLLVVIGRYVGEQWQTFMRIWGKVTSWAGIIVLLAGISVFLIYRYWHKKKITPSSKSNKDIYPKIQHVHNSHDNGHHLLQNENEEISVNGSQSNQSIDQDLEDNHQHIPDINQQHRN